MQIQNSVKCLHEARVVWGDAKAEDVLVDTKGAFRGSYSQG